MPKVTAPRTATVRMYNVGFGDCFLLTFQFSDRERHILVDFGSTAAPASGPSDFMHRIALDIAARCNGKLDVVVATHRHRDHISGFSTDVGTGEIIAALKPDHVIQPWTEHPSAETDALTADFLTSLEEMHAVADGVVRWCRNAKAETGDQARFLGENNLANFSAVRNLMEMGRRGQAHYVNAGTRLDDLLPGVKMTVLGPPTLKQCDSIRKQRSRDANEFWQFRSSWASHSRATAPARAPFRSTRVPPPNVRWFLRRSRDVHRDQMLELVRNLDNVINNTSVILLIQFGKQKLLFPGDAQIENWSFALRNAEWRKLLTGVNVYKVGHHGSLNATPKSLWTLFHNRGTADLQTLCSTKAGKHGSPRCGTEVPRRALVDELQHNSFFVSTETYGGELFRDFRIDCSL